LSINSAHAKLNLRLLAHNLPNLAEMFWNRLMGAVIVSKTRDLNLCLATFNLYLAALILNLSLNCHELY
jgi:hypothetical protein